MGDQESSVCPPTEPMLPTPKDFTHKFTIGVPQVTVEKKEEERNPQRLRQRQKQLNYGKNTLGYDYYTTSVPSKRSWDGTVSKWRRHLHVYDPPLNGDDDIAEDFSTRREITKSATKLINGTIIHKETSDKGSSSLIPEDCNSPESQ